MRKFTTFMLVPLLAACAGTDYDLTYSTSQHRNPSYASGPQNPTSAFSDPITAGNKNYTGMISNTDDQIARYIEYRLNEFKTYNPNIGKNISNLEIARAAAFLTDADLTAAQIEKYFGDNIALMHMAVYVVDNRLNRCFSGGGYGCSRVFCKVA